MRPLEPFAPGRAVLAAISGGADSMALAWLLRRWGDPLAVIVDHGLRPGSAAEAALTHQRLAAIRIPACVTTLRIPLGPALGARARDARYQALLAACREQGRPDLLLAHHAQDQAETVLLRRARATGPWGEAAMPLIAWRADARLLRPLLGIPPARLRATLRHAGLAWAEDPTNTDPATPRGALRTHPIPLALAHAATRAGARRHREEHPGTLATADLFPTAHARLRAPLPGAEASRLLAALSGRVHAPPQAAAERMLDAGGTLHGMVARGSLLHREAAAMEPPSDTLWDGRFTLRTPRPGATIGPLGPHAARLRRRSPLPAAVLRVSPAVKLGGELLPSPHLAYHGGATSRTVAIDFRPSRPVAGAPFHPLGHADAAREGG